MQYFGIKAQEISSWAEDLSNCIPSEKKEASSKDP